MQKVIDNRPYALVTYGGACLDCKIMEALDLDSRSLYHIDALEAAQWPLQAYHRYSLTKLLDALQLLYLKVHVASNHVRFTLYAMLVLVVHDWNLRRKNRTVPPPAPSLRKTLSSLKAIARAWWLAERKREPEPDRQSLVLLFKEPDVKTSVLKTKKGQKTRLDKTLEEKAVRKERKRLSKEVSKQQERIKEAIQLKARLDRDRELEAIDRLLFLS